jgi:diaminohydroxyphosphoribosylaminopyrimidine deaminase/5-amino-6-(5-phosphoribosylamino)uracil reductase
MDSPLSKHIKPMSAHVDHDSLMRLALDQAQQALFITSPNPRVGCVITDPQGRIIGLGHTQVAGQAHAEVMALRQAQSNGHSTHGATAYVTLEPCSHHGRTPPCTQALINAGVARVFVSLRDPNPKVLGSGIKELQHHGIEVDCGLLAQEALELNKGFFNRMRFGRPWMRSKIAATLDGQTALLNGQSKWITGEGARQDGHQWRARACAILTGVGTLMMDDPRLDTREIESPRTPALVIVDSQLRTPISAKALQFKRAMYLYCALPLNDEATEVMLEMEAGQRAAHQEKLLQLKDLGVEVTGLPHTSSPSAQSQVDLSALVLDLGAKDMNEVHIETGPTLNGSFIQSSLIDEFLIYLAPKWMGPAKPMSFAPALDDLSQALELDFLSFAKVGDDLRIVAEKKQSKTALFPQ